MKISVAMAIMFFVDITKCIEFPFNEFFNYANMSDVERTFMRTSFLCTAGNNVETLCECHKDCMKYQTCCIDYLWNTNQTESLQSYIQRFIAETKKYRQVTCSPLAVGLREMDSTDNLLMISKCPKNASKELKRNCKEKSQKFTTLPVVGRDGYVYRNKFCASCHHVDEFEMLEMKADCEYREENNSDNANILQEYSACKFSPVNNSKYSRFIKRCDLKTQNRCKVSKNKQHTIFNVSKCRLCKYYSAGVYTRDYTCCKNSFCCPEENVGGTQVRQKPNICFTAFSNNNDVLTFGFSMPRYSILVSYKKDLTSFNNPGDTCDSDGMYDTIAKKCIADARCGFGYMRKGSSCVKHLPKVHAADVPVILSDSNSSKEKSIERCLQDYVYVVIRINNSNKMEVKLHLNRSFSSKTYEIIHENTTTIILKLPHYNANLSYHFANLTSKIHYEVVKTSAPTIYPNSLYDVDFVRSFNGRRICASPVIHAYSEFEISSNCFVFINQSVLYINEYVIVTTLGLKSKHFLVTCQHFHLSKPCFIRPVTNYTVLPNNTVITEGKILYEVDEYIPVDNGVAVCIQTSPRKHMWMQIVDAVNGYLTLIGCVSSIIAYIWIIATYSSVRELRTTPGKNVACLCAMLMACDALMLASTATITCKYIAIFLHFFALSAQFWSVVVAFDIWSTFQGKTLSRNMKSRRRFISYCLFAWLCPLGLVLLSIILDRTKMAEVGYGENGICWITNLAARLTTYIVPVGVMTLFTVTTLSYTIYGIYRQCNKSKALLKKRGGENVNLAQMALKLVILLGGIEILGFIQFQGDQSINWIFDSIFQLIYTIVRSFRGVFIWLLYIVTDRVFKIYRRYSERRSRRKSSKLSVTNTRTFSTRGSEYFNTTLTISPTPSERV